MTTDLRGRLLGNYRIEELIGTGGMGRVYRAKHQYLRAEYAVKVLHDNFAANPDIRARFLREAQAMASLKHENIVQVSDFSEHEDIPYMAMELVNGGSLRSLFSHPESSRVSWSLLLGVELVRQAAIGLAAAHAEGIIHRDIKPENLLLQSGQFYTVKIVDFGLARLLDGKHLTLEEAKGTPAYMSPEQCQGLKLDHRSDLYSLGIVLYEAVTGSLPFVAPDSVTAEHHVSTGPVPHREVRGDIPEKLEQIILRCLAKKPADRYSSASELAVELQSVLREISGAPTPGDHKTKYELDHRRVPPVFAEALPVPETLATPCLLLADGNGRTLQKYDLSRQPLTVGRAEDNTICLNSDEVTRYHARLEWDGESVRITDLGSENGTFLEQNRLVRQFAQAWDGRHPIGIGPFWLRLALPKLRPVPTPVPAPTTQSRIGITVDRKSLTLTPGQPAVCTVTVANLGKIVDHIGLEIEGVPTDWVQSNVKELQLNPEGQGAFVLTINVPKRSSSLAQDYPVKLRAISRLNPDATGIAEAVWTVQQFLELRLEPSPTKASGSTGAVYDVVIHNDGNAQATCTLSCKDEEAKLDLAFEKNGLPHVEVNVPAGKSHSAPLKVTAPTRWFGNAHSHSLSVQALSMGGTAAKPVQFTHNSLIPTWAIAVLPIIVAAIYLLWPNTPTPPPEAPRFSCEAKSKGKSLGSGPQIRIKNGQSFTLSCKATGHDDGKTSFSVNGLSLESNNSFTAGKNVSDQTELKIIADNKVVKSQPQTLTVIVEKLPEPSVNAFKASKTDLIKGEEVKITWNVSDAKDILLSPINQRFEAKGSHTETPEGDRTYKLIITKQDEGIMEYPATVEVKVREFGSKAEDLIGTWDNIEDKDGLKEGDLYQVVITDKLQCTLHGKPKAGPRPLRRYLDSISTSSMINTSYMAKYSYSIPGTPEKYDFIETGMVRLEMAYPNMKITISKVDVKSIGSPGGTPSKMQMGMYVLKKH